MITDGPGADAFLSLLAEECEAIAAEVGAWLHNSPCQQQDPVPGERIELCVTQLGSLLKSQVTLTKARTLEEVQAGQRALVVHLDAAHPGSLIVLAADYAGIGTLQSVLWDIGEWPGSSTAMFCFPKATSAVCFFHRSNECSRTSSMYSHRQRRPHLAPPSLRKRLMDCVASRCRLGTRPTTSTSLRNVS